MFNPIFHELTSGLKRKYTMRWIFGFMTLFWYIITAIIVTKQPRPHPENFTPLLFSFILTAIIAGLCVLFYNKILFKDEAALKLIDDPLDLQKLAIGLKPKDNSSEVISRIKQLSNIETKTLALIHYGYGHHVIKSAFYEFPAILGLVSTITTGNINYLYPFTAYSIILRLLNRPNFDKYYERVEYLTKLPPKSGPF